MGASGKTMRYEAIRRNDVTAKISDSHSAHASYAYDAGLYKFVLVFVSALLFLI